MALYLSARQPFALEPVVNSHGWVQLHPFSRKDGLPGFRYVLQLASGRVAEIKVREAPGGVAVDFDAPLTPEEEGEVAARVAWMVALDQDLAPFYDASAHEPRLAQAAARAQGRILRSPTLFEDTVKTILTTNTSWAGTKRMVERLVTLYGAPLPDDLARHAFPAAERLATLDEAALRVDAKLGFRAPSVLALAQQVAAGELDLEALRESDLPTDEVRARLLAIRGVGPYAAANLLMILGRYDFLPVDSWARMLVSREWHGGQAVGEAEVQAAFAHWGEWRGLAYWFWEWKVP